MLTCIPSLKTLVRVRSTFRGMKATKLYVYISLTTSVVVTELQNVTNHPSFWVFLVRGIYDVKMNIKGIKNKRSHSK